MPVLRGRVPSRVASARARVGLARAFGACLVFLGLGDAAEAQRVERVARDLQTAESEAAQLLRTGVRENFLRSETFVEERIADAELQLQLGDPLAASIIFTDVVENHPAHRAYPDALFLLGESLFRAGDVY